jgi:hypothetical protein
MMRCFFVREGDPDVQRHFRAACSNGARCDGEHCRAPSSRSCSQGGAGGKSFFLSSPDRDRFRPSTFPRHHLTLERLLDPVAVCSVKIRSLTETVRKFVGGFRITLLVQGYLSHVLTITAP